MTTASAHLPFLSNGAEVEGSWFAGDTEDRFMRNVWRVRRWVLTSAGDLSWSYLGSSIVARGAGDGFIVAGENQTSPEFANEDDILCNWRQTYSRSLPEPVGGPAGLTIQWGPTGQYDETGRFGGSLSSSILFELNPFGDVSVFLGSEEGAEVGFGGNYLTEPAGAAFVFDPDGANVAVPLFSDANMHADYPGSSWITTAPLYLKPSLYWPWRIDGQATWDEVTGAEIRPHDRTGQNGFRLAYFAQQT